MKWIWPGRLQDFQRPASRAIIGNRIGGLAAIIEVIAVVFACYKATTEVVLGLIIILLAVQPIRRRLPYIQLWAPNRLACNVVWDHTVPVGHVGVVAFGDAFYFTSTHLTNWGILDIKGPRTAVADGASLAEATSL